MSIHSLIGRKGVLVSVNRPTYTTTPAGGKKVDTETQLYANIRAWIQPAGSSTVERFAQRGISVTHTAYFSDDPLVKEGDVIKRVSRTFVVRGYENSAELNRLFAIACEEMR